MTSRSNDPPVHMKHINGLDIAYRVSGAANGPTLLLIHGMAETSAYFWRPLINAFQDDYRIVAIDLLGHGDSSRPLIGYHPQTQISLYAQFIRELVSAPVILVGHSLGGIIGATLALYAPELISKLILYDSPIPRGLPGNLSLILDMRLLSLIAVSALAIPGAGLLLDVLTPLSIRQQLLTTVLKTWRVPFEPQSMTEALKQQSTRNSYFALEQHVRWLFLGHNLERQLHEIRIPTLILVGDHDVLLSTRRAHQLAAMMQHGECKVIQRAGHAALLDQPDVFNEHLRRFIRASTATQV